MVDSIWYRICGYNSWEVVKATPEINNRGSWLCLLVAIVLIYGLLAYDAILEKLQPPSNPTRDGAPESSRGFWGCKYGRVTVVLAFMSKLQIEAIAFSGLSTFHDSGNPSNG